VPLKRGPLQELTNQTTNLIPIPERSALPLVQELLAPVCRPAFGSQMQTMPGMAPERSMSFPGDAVESHSGEWSRRTGPRPRCISTSPRWSGIKRPCTESKPKRWALVSKLDEIAAFFATVHAAGVMPLSVGGDHSISLPILRAIARDRPLGLVHIDAHCDTGDDYLGSRFHHGASFRGTVEEGLIDPKRVVQIGIRGSLSTITLWQFSYGRWNARSFH